MRIYKTEDYIEQGKRIHVFFSEKKNGDVEPPHTHDFIEIVYVFSGNTTHVIDGVEYAVKHGDLLFLNYGSTHAFFSDKPYSYVNICFSPETLGNAVVTAENAFSLLSLTAFNEMRADAEGGVLSFAGEERGEVEQILRAMMREYERREPSWDTVMESYLSILITRMLRKTRLTASRTMDDAWRVLSDYIDENLGEELTLSALASKCFYNPSYFSRAFKEKFGVSFVEYVGRKRVEHAIALLRESEMSIDEISEGVGFADRRNLYHAFSKYAGATPAEFRLATRGKKTPQTGKSSKKIG